MVAIPTEASKEKGKEKAGGKDIENTGKTLNTRSTPNVVKRCTKKSKKWLRGMIQYSCPAMVGGR